ncbi:recombinase family protein [Tsukamurella strandjordii]|uniref:Recombinase family protein n=1 Tax=Tsukamurella strandjordii TaxID=147577 RepID=A0AA90NBV7_9ACTN|nr:recombinase family protein [Tsukamurella strandjordii]MDP0398913.1 recombinase family protein [Tsukamurella strandjordii]
MKLIGYVRVSTKEQGDEGHGLAAQRHSLEQWCAANDHELLTVMTDVVSGTKATRMHGREIAIAAIEQGLADGLLVRALDRATRSQLDFATLMKRAEDYGWHLLDCEEGVSSDPSKRIVMDVKNAVAAEERRRISLRTKEGLARARREGKALGRKESQAVKDAKRRIHVLADRGMGAKAIAAQLTTEQIPAPRGGSQWSYTTVRDVLARRDTAKAVA